MNITKKKPVNVLYQDEGGEPKGNEIVSAEHKTKPIQCRYNFLLFTNNVDGCRFDGKVFTNQPSTHKECYQDTVYKGWKEGENLGIIHQPL